MNQERIPLLSAEAQHSPVVEQVTNPVVLPELKVSSSPRGIGNPSSENQLVNQTSENSAIKPTPEAEAPKPPTAIEGYLVQCGGCHSSVLFPYGFTRVVCSSCKSINYLVADSIPRVTRKALMICPNCNASILYTIGCTHFKCICGSVLQIPIPDYYIPHFPSDS